MRLRGPIRAPGDLPGRRPLASPTCSPGSRCRAATPAPEPAEKFHRCKREKSQLGRTPAPTQSPAPPPQPDPWRRRPWPPRTLPRAEGGVLPCWLSGGHRRRLGAVATGPGVLGPQVGPPHPPPGLPAGPGGARPGRRGRPTYPAAQGRGSGRVRALHPAGSASRALRAVALGWTEGMGGGLCRRQTLGGLWLLLLFCPRALTPSFSLVSRPFFPG